MISFDKILNDVKDGKPLIIVDDQDREAEGDLVIAAQCANPYNLAFMLKHGRGLMCIPCLGKTLDDLNIPMMPTNKLDKFSTPFTVSVDSVLGTSGISVLDRLKTINVFLNPNSTPNDLSQPGHMFPLRAKAGLLKARRGHTESSLEVVIAAGVSPVSVIIEIMNDDGTVAKGQQLIDYSKIYNLNILSVQDLYSQLYEK
jgi:3,4-dihydroxy 2-butanone 4-phosphate synthase/GTP cyclohydrolase II